jgi:transposase-like protein
MKGAYYGKNMHLLAKCPKCSHEMVLVLNDADKRKRCRRCGRLFKVPQPEHLQKALDLLQKAKVKVYVDEKGNLYG